MIIDNSEVLTLNSNSSIHKVEQFVESVCDNVFINETYFGNILITVSEVFTLLKSEQPEFELKVSYGTDFQFVSIIFYGIGDLVLNELSAPAILDQMRDSTFRSSIFLIKSLSDNVSATTENGLQITFNIGAIHNNIYQERAILLKKYLNGFIPEKVKLNNDFN